MRAIKVYKTNTSRRIWRTKSEWKEGRKGERTKGMLDRPQAWHSVLNRPQHCLVASLSLSLLRSLFILTSVFLANSLSLFLCVVHLTHLIGLARPPCLRSFILFNSIFCCLLLLPIFVLLLLSRPFLRALLLRYTNTYAHTYTLRVADMRADFGFWPRWRIRNVVG